MSESNFIKIYTGSYIITQLIVDKLESIGITPIVKDQTESGRGAIFGSNLANYQELYVNNDELDQAVPIVESVTAELKA